MITVCFADTYPVVHYGVKSYFENHQEISVIANVGNFQMVHNALINNKIDVLVIDLELDGLQNIHELKNLSTAFPNTKILIFTSLNEQIYSTNTYKVGISAFIHKSSKLEKLGKTIVRVHHGAILIAPKKENIQNNIKNSKHIGVQRKLSNREIEVLHYLSKGKKNIEISKILELNEKTISTYKKRLLQKLNVTNVIDLVYKVKALGVI